MSSSQGRRGEREKGESAEKTLGKLTVRGLSVNRYYEKKSTVCLLHTCTLYVTQQHNYMYCTCTCTYKVNNSSM